MKDKNNLEPSDYKTGISNTCNFQTIDLGNAKGKFDTVFMTQKDYEKIQKKLKALEIIQKCCLLGSYPNETYELAFSTKIDITKEEYDLLKEVLL